MEQQIPKCNNSLTKQKQDSKGNQLTVANAFLSGPQLSQLARIKGDKFIKSTITAHLLRLNMNVSETERISPAMIKECTNQIQAKYFFWNEKDLKLAFDWCIGGKFKIFGRWDTPKVMNCMEGFEIERVAEAERIRAKESGDHKNQPVSAETKDMLERYAIMKKKANEEIAKKKAKKKEKSVHVVVPGQRTKRDVYREEWEDLSVEEREGVSCKQYVDYKIDGTL